MRTKLISRRRVFFKNNENVSESLFSCKNHFYTEGSSFFQKKAYFCQKKTLMTIYSIYDQIADLIARIDPTKVMALKAPDEMQKRLTFLIGKSKDEQLDKKEKDELDHFIVLERLIRLAKIRAHEHQSVV